MDQRGHNVVLALFIAVCWFIAGYNIGGRKRQQKPDIKPCECISYSQYALWQAKYDLYVDKNKPDSVAKYAELLRQIK